MILLMFLEALLSPALSYWSGRQRFEYRYRILVCVTILQALMNDCELGADPHEWRYGHDEDPGYRRSADLYLRADYCVPVLQRKRVLFEGILGLRTADRIPIVPHYLSGIILNQGDRIMIDKMVGKTEVALYGLAYSIGMLVQLFISGMNSALTPWMYSKIKKGDIRSMRKVLQLLSVVVVGIAVALMLISPELVLIFGSPKYREAVYVIPPVAASVFFIFIYNILSMPQFYYEKTQFLMAASMAAAGANVVLNFIFIRLFGYIAAGYTTLACYMLYSVGHYIVSKRILVNEGIQENLMSPGFLVACSAFLIGASIICNLIFPYRILRYAILLASAGLVFWKKELLLKTMADNSEGNKKWGRFETNVQRLPVFARLDSHRKNDTMKE